MFLPVASAVALTLCAALVAGKADAATPTEARIRSLASSRIIEGRPALAPFQHARFCLRNPADCQPTSGGDVELTPELLVTLRSANREANGSIRPLLKDYRTNTAERWEIAPGAGDCNDYAVTKRHLLLAKNIPSSALKLTVVRTNTGQGHLVLVVSTTTGDLVLDNLTPDIRPWKSANYEWIKIQSERDPRLWHYVVNPATTVSAIGDGAALRIAHR